MGGETHCTPQEALCDASANTTLTQVMEIRRKKGHGFAPFFLASDGQSPHRDAELIAQGAIVYDHAGFGPTSGGALAVDLLLLSFADVFICNPDSSITRAVGSLRTDLGL